MIPALLPAQCDKAKITIDKFTGDTIFSSKVKCATLTKNFDLTFVKMKGHYYVGVNYSVSGSKVLVVGATDSLQLKLGNGQIIALAPMGTQSADIKRSGNYIYTNIYALYACSAEQMEMISQQGCAMIRILFVGDLDTLELKEKTLPLIKDSAACILQPKK